MLATKTAVNTTTNMSFFNFASLLKFLGQC